jgi:hypothetical protein
MNRSTISSEPKRKICEASACSAEAVREIVVKVGERATISLQLCKNCVSKFQDK